jgi:hypothetical protein
MQIGDLARLILADEAVLTVGAVGASRLACVECVGNKGPIACGRTSRLENTYLAKRIAQ